MKTWFAVGLHRCYKAFFCLVVLLFSGSGIAAIIRAESDVLAHYQWLQPNSPCSSARQERLFRQGFRQDWQRLSTCQHASDLWWVLELKPKVRRAYHTRTSRNDSSEIIFEFEPDFYTRFNRLTRETYNGPPKWMPPSLAYWDAGIGDWRYLRHDIHMGIASEVIEPDLMMLWIKYESFEEGVIWDASFDFNNLMELLGLARLNLGSVATRILELFQLKSD